MLMFNFVIFLGMMGKYLNVITSVNTVSSHVIACFALKHFVARILRLIYSYKNLFCRL